MFKIYRLLHAETALHLAHRLKAAAWDKGKSRTAKADGRIKDNQEIVPRSDKEPFWPDIQGITAAVKESPGFLGHTLLHKMTVPKFNRYAATEGGGMAYHRHFDASPMTLPEMRTDYACTLFLNSPDDYEGGQLTLETPDGHHVKAPRGQPGEAVVYECGGAHWVTPVTHGERICSVMWIRSLIKDPKQRHVFRTLGQTLLRWEHENRKPEAHGEDFTTLTGVHAELARMWIDA